MHLRTYIQYKWRVIKRYNYTIDLISLQSIQLGKNALRGEDGERRMEIRKEPYNYKNKLTMRSEEQLIINNRSSYTDTNQRGRRVLPVYRNSDSRK